MLCQSSQLAGSLAPRRSGWLWLWFLDRAVTVNCLGPHPFAIFDADRFPFNILDAYAPSVQAFHQLHCCRAAFSRLGRFIKSQPRNLLFLLSELHLVCSRPSIRDTGLAAPGADSGDRRLNSSLREPGDVCSSPCCVGAIRGVSSVAGCLIEYLTLPRL